MPSQAVGGFVGLGRFLLIFVSGFLITISAQAQEGTEGLNVMEYSQTSARSPWGMSFFSIGSLTQKQIENGGSSFSAYNYLGLNYKFGSSQRVSIRPVFFYNTEGRDKGGRKVEADTSLGDMHLVYSDYDFAEVAGADVSLSMKLYLPTSEYSQATKMIATIRPETIVSWRVGRYSRLSWVIKPDFIIQSNATYVDPNAARKADGTYKRDPRRNTKAASLEHYLEFDASMSKYFSILPSVGFEEDWYNDGGTEYMKANHTTTGKLALGFAVRPVRRMSVILGAENKVRLSNRRDKVTLFRPEDSGLVLLLIASM